MCYVLIGYWSTPKEDLERVMHLWDDYRIDAFVMPYDKFDPYQRKFARWCNNKVIFKTRSWEQYCDGFTNTIEDYRRLLEKRKKNANLNQKELIME